MKDAFRLKLERKKKEIDQHISDAKDENSKNTLMTLRKELGRMNNVKDLESRIVDAVNFKNQAKKDSTRAVFGMFERELKGLRTSVQGGTAPETREASRPDAGERKARKAEKLVKTGAGRKGRHEFAIVTLTGIHRMAKKKEPPAHIRRTDEKIRRVRHAAKRLPQLRLDMEAIREHVQGHEEFRKDMKASEEHVHEKVKDVMDSLAGLRTHLAKKMKEKKIEEAEKDRLLEETSKKLNTKVDLITRKLEESLGMLSRKIEESTAVSKMEMAGNINFLRSQIEEVKGQLPKRAKREVTGKERKRKHVKKPEEGALSEEAQPTDKEISRAASRVKRPKAPQTVKLSGLSRHIGKDVTVEAEARLTKKVEEGEARMYGYILKDGTGEVMLTSTEEIGEGKARIRCTVNETPKGRVYLRFVEIAR